jgi:hypothetical protein
VLGFVILVPIPLMLPAELPLAKNRRGASRICYSEVVSEVFRLN